MRRTYAKGLLKQQADEYLIRLFENGLHNKDTLWSDDTESDMKIVVFRRVFKVAVGGSCDE